MSKTIGIFSIKGGVGKTSSVIALGDALSKLGKKVLLVDANFTAPNLGMHLRMIDPEKTLNNVLNKTATIGEALQSYDDFDVLPSGIFNKERFNPMELRNKLRNIKRNYDFVIIDSSPAMNDETLSAMIASDELFIVTTPDYPTLSTTIKSIKLARLRNTKIDGLILNKVHNKKFELSLGDIEIATEIPVVAVIPHDIHILESLSKFIPSTSHNPMSKASKEYRRLAEILAGSKSNPFSLRNLFGMTPKKEEINREIFYKSQFG